ncbi:MAG: sulfatase [Phycisphaeraceae bacterium]|nr:sulfatase [Phycisphaeraceae bacterium]
MNSRPRNIVFVICHDLGRELGCYGAGVATPNLDRFAGQGARCDAAFTNSPCCSPSRGTIQTGRYAHHNGLMGLVNQGWSMPLAERTIVDHLNDAGFETLHTGFQHERAKHAMNRYSTQLAPDHRSEDVFARAIAHLAQRKDSRPFYMNLGLLEVHESGWNSQDRFDHGSRYEAFMPALEEVHVPPWLPDVKPIRREMRRFRGCIRFMDHHFATLIEGLDKLGLAENTLVVFATDHGISGVRSKSTLYDHGVEVALMLRGPGVRTGMVVDDLIQTVDIAPTLLEAVGVEAPAGMDGRSFWPRLTGEAYRPHEMIFTERNYHGGFDPMRAVRTRRYHYIRNFADAPKWQWLPGEVERFNDRFEAWYNDLWPPLSKPRPAEELYDVMADPHETRNLAGDAALADVRRELAAALHRWMVETNDPLLQGPIPDRLHPHPHTPD